MQPDDGDKPVKMQSQAETGNRRAAGEKEKGKMTVLMIQAITKMGCCVYASINVSEDYTMNEIVKEVKRLGYVKFRLIDTMKRFADV